MIKWGILTLTLQLLLRRSCHLNVIGVRSGPIQLCHKPVANDIRKQNRTVDVVDEEKGNYNNCQNKQSHLENFIDVGAIAELGAVQATVILFIAIDVILNVGGVHGGQEKGNLVYAFFAVLHYRPSHTNAVLSNAAAKGLKKEELLGIVKTSC